MEDNKFRSGSEAPETSQNPPSRVDWDSLMEEELKKLEQLVEEGNRLLGLPPLPPEDY